MRCCVCAWRKEEDKQGIVRGAVLMRLLAMLCVFGQPSTFVCWDIVSKHRPPPTAVVSTTTTGTTDLRNLSVRDAIVTSRGHRCYSTEKDLCYIVSTCMASTKCVRSAQERWVSSLARVQLWKPKGALDATGHNCQADSWT